MLSTTLEEIADRLGAHRYDGYLLAKCVFHADHTPSMFVNDKTYNCASCNSHGKTDSLLQYLRTGQFQVKNTSHYHPQLWNRYSDMNIEDLAFDGYRKLRDNPEYGYYLKERKIDSMIEPCKIGFMDGWYTFPVFDQSRSVVGIVARAGKVIQSHTNFRWIMPKGQPPLLYVPNWSLLSQSCLVLVYGIIDAISLAKLGYPAIACTYGHNVPPELLKPYRKLIYIIPDGDGKDLQYALRLQSSLGWRGKILKLSYPTGKDMNDVLSAGQEEFIIKSLEMCNVTRLG